MNRKKKKIEYFFEDIHREGDLSTVFTELSTGRRKDLWIFREYR